MPSVVSMPPNKTTAALDVTSAALSPPGPAASVSSGARPESIAARTPAASSANDATGDVVGGAVADVAAVGCSAVAAGDGLAGDGAPAGSAATAATMSRYQASTVPGVIPTDPRPSDCAI